MFLGSRFPSISARNRDSTTIQPPTPVLAPIVASPNLDNDPQSDIPLGQQTTDDIARKVNDLVHAAQPHVVVPHIADSAKVAHLSDKQDKENQSVDDESWSHVSAEVSHSGGIGLGVGLAEGRAIGRDLANIGPIINKVRKDKEKKGRRQYSSPS